MLTQLRRTLSYPAAIAVVLLGVASPAHAQAGLLLYVPQAGVADSINVYRLAASGRVTFVTTIAGGGNDPVNVAVRADQAFAYVTFNGSNQVGVIDTRTHTIVQTLPTGAGPRGVAISPDGSLVYVANNSLAPATTITKFRADRITGQLTAAGQITTGNRPRAVAFSPDGTKLYVANQTSNNVVVIDVATDTIVATIANGGQNLDLAVNPAGTRAYVTSTAGLYVLDLTNNSLVTQVDAAAGTLSGVRVSNNGARVFATNTNINRVRVYDAATDTLINSVNVTGSAPLGLVLSPSGGNLYLTNNANNVLESYAVNDAALTILENPGTGSAPGNLGICANGNQLLGPGRFFVANDSDALGCSNLAPAFTGGTLLVNGNNLTFTATFTVGTGGGTIDTNGADTIISGDVSASGNPSLSKAGAGVLTLSGANSYRGPIAVEAGTLRVTGSLSIGVQVAVASGATLDGSGTIGGSVSMSSGSRLSPGNPGDLAGSLSTGTLIVNPGATLAIALNGATAGTGHDRVSVAGTVNLGGTLSATLGAGFNPAFGQVFTIIDNDRTDPVAGTFAGLPEGTRLAFGGRTFQISYTGGTGNDVTLTATGEAGKIDQSITFPAIANRTLADSPFAVSATASSGLTVTFSSQTPTVCSVSGTTVTLHAGGICAIAADQPGDAAYNAAPQVTRSFFVTATTSCAVTPSQLPAALVGIPYSQALSLGNAVSPVSWSISGTLPPGLAFTSGVFSGTPTTRGSFGVTVSGADANGCQSSRAYTFAISAERRLLAGAGAGGVGTGGVGAALAFNLSGNTPIMTFISGGGFHGGTSVAAGDVDGNGFDDVIAGAGPGGMPSVTIFDGSSGAAWLSFFAFPQVFTGGVEVAAGDINGDSRPEILAVQGCGSGGNSTVRAFDGRTGALMREYAVSASVASCGLHVAAGDVNGDGAADIIVGSAGLGPSFVRVIDGSSGVLIREFFPYSSAYTGGVFVAAGDVSGDGFADIVTGAGPGGTPHVRAFDGVTGNQIAGALGSFFAYPSGFSGGVRVAAGDLNGDGRAEVITGAGPGGGPHVRVFDGATTSEILGMFAFDSTQTRGLFVAGPTPLAHMAVDIAARTAGTQVRIAGWALRQIAVDTTGTDEIHAWAVPAAGGTPVFVGAASGRSSRPDVAAFFGGEFLMSGFDFTGTLAPGTYDLIVYARNSRTLRFDQARVVRLTVQ